MVLDTASSFHLSQFEMCLTLVCPFLWVYFSIAVWTTLKGNTKGESIIKFDGCFFLLVHFFVSSTYFDVQHLQHFDCNCWCSRLLLLLLTYNSCAFFSACVAAAYTLEGLLSGKAESCTQPSGKGRRKGHTHHHGRTRRQARKLHTVAFAPGLLGEKKGRGESETLLLLSKKCLEYQKLLLIQGQVLCLPCLLL